jgi:glycosyltransferase involved in cell wall biosynthesis
MNEEKPLISICIPAYQRLLHLRRLLDSLVAQTFTNYEIIITDDSPDDTVAQLAREFSRLLPISYSKNDPPAGSPLNWNIAMQKARGKWIMLMHDDDWFAHAGALEKFADAAKTAKCDFVFSACNNIYSSGKTVPEYLAGKRKKLLEDNTINLFYQNVIGHPSTVMHVKDNSILYDTRFKWVVDIDFYIRYLQQHKGFHYIPEMLVNIGTDDTQLSYSLHKNPAVEIPEYFSMLAKFPSDLLMQHEHVFHCVWGLMKRFRIRNIKMIEDLGYTGQMPDHLQEILDYQQPIPNIVIKQSNWSRLLMKRCYRKLKAQGLNK